MPETKILDFTEPIRFYWTILDFTDQVTNILHFTGPVTYILDFT